MSGTSMSAPAASGIIATWLQANPALTPDDIKLIISDTAITDDFTAAAPNRFGYGKINSYEGLNKALQLASVETVQEMKKPMMICIRYISPAAILLIFLYGLPVFNSLVTKLISLITG